jgi:cyclophilin family peptidyl-prolyl cis-trans isomerase
MRQSSALAAVLLFCGTAAFANEPIMDAAPTVDAPVEPTTSSSQLSGPIATMVTSKGTITITLDQMHAPITVKNFVRYVKDKHYDGTSVYRVEPGLLFQAGSYKADGTFKSGLRKPISFEGNTGLKHLRGAVAMARGDDPVSAQAEFFIDLIDVPSFDHTPGDVANKNGYAVFGYVTGGLDVLDAIGATPVGGGKGPFPKSQPMTPIVIEKVTIDDAAH